MQEDGKSMGFFYRLSCLWLFAGVLALAGCVDREPQQRAAFIHFLQTRVLDAPGALAPRLSDHEREELGDYDEHYEVIEAFQQALGAGMDELDQALRTLSLHSLGEIAERGGQFEALRGRLEQRRRDLMQALARADEARATLLQADDLKQAYAPAYHHAVTEPAAALLAVYPAILDTLADAHRVAQFAQAHAGQLLIDGPLAQVRDPSVQARFNTLLTQLNGRSGDIDAAARQLQALRSPTP